MDNKERIAALFGEIVGDWRVQVDCPLSRLTTFKIGGPAAYVVTPSNVEELKKIIEVSRENGLKMLVLGKGSNILACDEGFRGVIVHLDFNFNNVKVNGTIVEAESGITLSALAKKAAEKGLGGLEFASGIQAETSFVSFQAALEYVFKLAEDKRIILVIDEYPYVARSSKSLASTLQLLIDKYKDIYDFSEIIPICESLKGEMVLVVKGYEKENENIDVSFDDLVKEIDNLINQGNKTTKAIKMISEQYNVSRSELYQYYHELKER